MIQNLVIVFVGNGGKQRWNLKGFANSPERLRSRLAVMSLRILEKSFCIQIEFVVLPNARGVDGGLAN